jgi:hypothetical protein
VRHLARRTRSLACSLARCNRLSAGHIRSCARICSSFARIRSILFVFPVVTFFCFFNLLLLKEISNVTPSSWEYHFDLIYTGTQIRIWLFPYTSPIGSVRSMLEQHGLLLVRFDVLYLWFLALGTCLPHDHRGL